jgi:hypothetical protein
MKRIFMLLPFLLIAAACDSPQVAQLHRENADLKTQTSQQQAASQFDLSAKCADESSNFYKDFSKGITNDHLISYTDHWNRNLNKCFILITDWFMYSGQPESSKDLFDVLEGKSYGSFLTVRTLGQKPLDCEMSADGSANNTKFCASQDEFDSFANPYMNN